MSIPYDKLGALERPKDERDFPLGAAQLPIPRPPVFLPDNSWLQRNYQAQTPTCGPHAESHHKAILDHARDNSTPRFTPRFTAIRMKDPSSPVYDHYAPDEGTDMRSLFKAAQAGQNTFEPLENNTLLPLGDYLNPSAVTSAMISESTQHLIGAYAFALTDFESVCQAIYQNKAVILTIKCDEGFWGVNTPSFTVPKYGHFVCADGYDESAGYVRVIDSAEPQDIFAVKNIKKEYFTPEFIREAGTAVDILPSVHQALSQQQLDLARIILDDMAKILNLDLQLLQKKVDTPKTQ
jgi:hypothetical protein